MVTTKMNWSGPNGIHFGRKSQFGPDQFITVVTISFWSWPNHYGQVQINLVRPKPFWTDQNCFGHIEGQGIRTYLEYIFCLTMNSDLLLNLRLKPNFQFLWCRIFGYHWTYLNSCLAKGVWILIYQFLVNRSKVLWPCLICCGNTKSVKQQLRILPS